MELNKKQFSLILEALRATPRGMNVTEVAKKTGMNRATVAKYLDVLSVSGHADMRLFGTSKVYYISQRMPISAFLNFSSDLIIVLDKNSRVMNANDSFLEFTGTRREDIVYKNIGHFAFPLKFDPPIDPYIARAINGNGATVESFYRKNDRGYYFNVKLIPLIFDEGEKGVTVLFEDITEKKLAQKALHDLNRELERKVKERTAELEKANEALRKDEAYLLEAQQLAHVGYWAVNLKTNENTASEEAYRVFGKEPGSKWTQDEFLSRVHPDDRPMIEKTNMDAIVGGKPIDYEYRILLPDGSMRIVHSVGEVRRNAKGEAVEIFGMFQDITGRKQAEEALRRSEENFQAAFEQAAVGTTHVSKDGHFMRVNQKFCDITGYSREELAKLTIEDITYPPDIAGEKQLIERLLAGELPTFSREKRYVRKDGAIIWVNLTVTPIFHNGMLEHLAGTTEDITERKRMEIILEKYRLFSENARDIALFVRRDGRILEANQAAIKTYGYTHEELLSLTIYDLRPTDPERRVDEQMETAFNQGILFEALHRRKDGSTFPVEVSSRGRIIDGEKVLFSVVRDITERKRAEEALRESEARFRSVLENSYDMIYRVNLQTGRCEYMSPSIETELGFSPDEIMAMDFETMESLMHPDDQPARQARTARLLETGKAEAVYRQRTKGGDYHWISNHLTLTRDGAGRPLYLDGDARDITELKRAEEALRESEARLRSVLDNTSDMIYRTNLQTGRCEYMSPSTETVLGFSPSELNAMDFETMESLMHPDEPHVRQADAIRLLETGKVEAVYRQRTKGGDYRWISNHMTLIRDSAGQPLYADGNARDITELKQAEEALRQQGVELEAQSNELIAKNETLENYIRDLKRTEEELASSKWKITEIMESIQDGFMSLDRDWRFTFINRRAAGNRGFEPEDLVGQNIWEKFPETVGSPPEAVYRKAMETREVQRIEIPGALTDQWYDITVYPSAEGISVYWQDISERKRAEEALRKSEVELARAQGISHIGSWTWDLITDDVTWSDESYRNYGLVPGELKPSYELFLSFIVPEDRERVDREIRRAIEGGHEYNVTYKIIRRDGTPKILLSENEVITDGAGKVIKMYGTNQDITERKRSEEALRESEEKYRFLVENSKDISWKIDPMGRWTFVSSNVERMTGLKPAEIVGRAIWEFLAPECHDLVRGKLQRRSRGEDVPPYEVLIIGKDGRKVPFELSATPIFDDDGKIAGIQGVSRDITLRKRAEEALCESDLRFKALFEGAGVAIFVVDINTGVVTDCNTCATQLTGRTREEIIGTHHSLMHPSNPDEHRSKHNVLYLPDGNTLNYETEILHKDGRRIPILVNSTIIEVGGKKVMMTSYIDATSLRRSEGALRDCGEKHRSPAGGTGEN